MQENKKHIALVTTWFPPQIGVAVNRMLAFVKYLNYDKFDISVITLRSNSEQEQEKMEGAKVYRIKNNSFLYSIPTIAGEPKIIHNLKVLWNVLLNNIKTFEYSVWMESAIDQLETIHSQTKIDVVISSFSPVEAHLAANNFCKKHPEVKWIADMRDEMSRNPHASPKIQKHLAKIEYTINKRANAITTVSEPILNDFKKILSSIKYFEEVRNGFDHNFPITNNFNEIFTIAYAGTFYGTRKPNTFFKGLKQFTHKTDSKIRLQFIGTNKNFDLPYELVSSSEFIPILDNKEAVERISKADANLLILPSIERKGVYTGKIFDYISVMKPVIAVCDSSDVAAKLIREMNAGFIADFNDINQIEQAISSAYNLWRDKKSLSMNKEKVDLLHRKYQVKKLELLIDKLLSE